MSDKDENNTELDAIELLVISSLQDSAQTISTLLRDAGHNIDVTWLDKPEALPEQLKKHVPRLVCCETPAPDAESPEAGNRELIRLIGLSRNLVHGVPVIAVVPELDPAGTDELLQAGAHQVVSLGLPSLARRSLEQEIELVELRDRTHDDKRRLRHLEKRLGIIVAESPDALAYVQEGIHTHLNSSYASLFGFGEPEELEGVPFMDLVAPASRDQVKQQLLLATKKQARTEFTSFGAQRADESNVTLNLRCRPVQVGGEDQLEILIKRETPALLPAPSNAFEGRLALYDAISDGAGLPLLQRSVGLLFLRIDDFDKLQDRLGLKAVDEIMHEVALFLREETGAEDRVFRFDVCEFVVLTIADSTAVIEQKAGELLGRIDRKVFGEEQAAAPLTATIAVAHLSDAKTSVSQLLKTLRLANRSSLREGNTVVVESSAKRADSARELDRIWLDRVKNGLANNRFALTYQGIASLEGDQSMLYDIFLRLQGDEGEQIKAGEFLPTAARHGLMPAIDQWVVRAAFEKTAEQQKHDQHALLFVKLSSPTIESAAEFWPWLQTLIRESSVDVERLAIAFDEETLQANMKKATILAEALDKAGFKLAIHNFGATSKSLQLLDMAKADFIKLDASFTAALVSPDENTRLVETIQAAQAKQIKIIASQVEDANSMARLWQAGVDYVQGYFVQEPTTTTEASDLNVA